VREFILTPIIINDNLIDISIVPQNIGETAAVEWRPQTGAF
jgi:D-alanyl-D-alanine carboxypeptidase/D-alanyl-D-alanine-endopeptidase (penicillin-binding protein 4)